MDGCLIYCDPTPDRYVSNVDPTYVLSAAISMATTTANRQAHNAGLSGVHSGSFLIYFVVITRTRQDTNEEPCTEYSVPCQGQLGIYRS